MHLQEAYMEEIVVTGERWREPPRDDDEWRPQTRTWVTGRITRGYDSAYDELHDQRDLQVDMSGPTTTEDLPNSTVFRIRF